WVPIDITELFFILSLCIGILVFLGEKKRFNKKATILALSGAAFAFYIFISLNWSAGHIYAVQKTLHISTLTLWALFACAFIIASDTRRLNRFINLILAIAAWIALASALEYVKGGGGVINALNSNYLALGYTLGMGLIISIAYVFFFEQSRSRKIALFIISLFFMFLLLVLGGRGPLIGVTISLLIPLLYRAKVRLEYKLWIKKYFVFIVILLIAVFSVSIYLYSKDSPTATLARILLLFEPGMGTSVSTRVEYYLASYILWQFKPLLGHGIGSWPILIGLPDRISYPHNMVLEIIVELGLMGLILFGFILFWALKGFIHLKYNRSIFFTFVILMMFINAFMGAMFSGDMNDNRIIFALLGLMAFDEGKYEVNKGLKIVNLQKRVRKNEK
ncbi:MAG TPA: O-antigen ligase family protein, partial [Patescibacteria group bacterium]|nr:O-antigen ligase family protein [Patescibacteria group bacterium]